MVIKSNCICPINLILRQSSGLNDILTNLGPTSVNLIYYAPKFANLGFWKIG